MPWIQFYKKMKATDDRPLWPCKPVTVLPWGQHKSLSTSPVSCCWFHCHCNTAVRDDDNFFLKVKWYKIFIGPQLQISYLRETGQVVIARAQNYQWRLFDIQPQKSNRAKCNRSRNSEVFFSSRASGNNNTVTGTIRQCKHNFNFEILHKKKSFSGDISSLFS